nr:DNA damage-inducible protein 1 [Cryptococcus depauperatus CBS 7855]
MRLTIIAPDSIQEHDVSPLLLVQDIINIVEATANLPPAVIVLTTDSGTPLVDPTRSLESYNLTGESATIFLTPSDQPIASTSALNNPDADVERMRLQMLGNPSLMSHIKNTDPTMYEAIQGGTESLKKALADLQERQRDAELEKQRQIAALNADPYDIEAQKKIEEAIRFERVVENMQHAMEFSASPEAFGNVHMLYINMEVNGHPVKAFVDSGAQATIISPELAEQCGIMRLLDTRFAGMAEGVGTARILGRVHSTQIKLGNLYLPCSFSVLEGRSVDLLFGLDMLKRHQCCIDLASNSLRINDTEVPFLSEHELPDKARRRGAAEIAEEMGQAAGQGIKAGVASSRTTTTSFPGAGRALNAEVSTGPSAGVSTAAALGASTVSRFKEDDIKTLIGLGAPRAQAIQLLEATGGNVDVAASMLFG